MIFAKTDLELAPSQANFNRFKMFFQFFLLFFCQLKIKAQKSTDTFTFFCIKIID